MSDTKDRIRTNLIAGASGTVDLIKKAEISDPQLAQSLTAKSLIGSKSIWAPAATALVSWAVTHYGIAMDPDTSAMVSGLLAWVVVVICRYVTRSPIGGIITTPPPAAAP